MCSHYVHPFIKCTGNYRFNYDPLKINYSHHLISVRKDLGKFELGSYTPLNKRVRKPYGFGVGHIVRSCS